MTSPLETMTWNNIWRLIERHSTELPSRTPLTPRVSVRLTTYNHALFLEQALRGALNQRTTFDYEIVIGDDCSTDGTWEILTHYAALHPERLRVFRFTRNLGHLTGNGRLNGLRTLRACRGQYIALCEGDDYWTDDMKLQKQFDALEAHADWHACFHPARHFDQTANRYADVNIGPRVFKDTYTVDDLLEHCNFIPTCSVMFRRRSKPFPKWYLRTPFGDWPMHLLNALEGLTGFINQPMAVYRAHRGGVHSGLPSHDKDMRIHACYNLIGSCPALRARASYRNGLLASRLRIVASLLWSQQGIHDPCTLHRLITTIGNIDTNTLATLLQDFKDTRSLPLTDQQASNLFRFLAESEHASRVFTRDIGDTFLLIAHALSLCAHRDHLAEQRDRLAEQRDHLTNISIDMARGYWRELMQRLKSQYELHRVAFYGAGLHCRWLITHILPPDLLPARIFDDTPSPQPHGIPVVSSAGIRTSDTAAIVVASDFHHKPMLNKLRTLAPEGVDLVDPYAHVTGDGFVLPTRQRDVPESPLR